LAPTCLIGRYALSFLGLWVVHLVLFLGLRNPGDPHLKDVVSVLVFRDRPVWYDEGKAIHVGRCFPHHRPLVFALVAFPASVLAVIRWAIFDWRGFTMFWEIITAAIHLQLSLRLALLIRWRLQVFPIRPDILDSVRLLRSV
jgi:hypothetical protein